MDIILSEQLETDVTIVSCVSQCIQQSTPVDSNAQLNFEVDVDTSVVPRTLNFLPDSVSTYDPTILSAEEEVNSVTNEIGYKSTLTQKHIHICISRNTTFSKCELLPYCTFISN